MTYIDSRELLKLRVKDFLDKYGDKGVVVLRSAVEVSMNNGFRSRRFGDFSYKSLVIKLRSMGINYNPSNLLRILERNYGILEKTFSSSNQTWYKFIDIDAVREAIQEYMGIINNSDDPDIRLLRIKYRSLQPDKILSVLKSLYRKPRLNKYDIGLFREIVFKDLDLVTDLLNRMLRYEDLFTNEIMVLNEILVYADYVASKIAGINVGTFLEDEHIQYKKAIMGREKEL